LDRQHCKKRSRLTLALVATMTGAVFTHLFIAGGSPAPALVLGVGAAAIAWARRDQF
jgi:hypothetical protein